MPPVRDTSARLFTDLCSAFGLLTRLPAPQTARHRANAAWGWPLVGLVVGGLTAGAGAGALALGLPLGVAAAVTICTGTIATGALHEDGLADSADGLFGGWTTERRLEIMKDSHIGSYGTLALVLVMMAKIAALSVLLGAGTYGAVIAAAVISRAPMAAIMALLPAARTNGLSHGVGRPSRGAAGAAVAIAFLLALMLTQGALIMILAAALAALGVALVARARLGGQTGDILGAAQQMAELAALMAASAIVTG